MKLPTSVPKPKKRPARARQWNSTIAVRTMAIRTKSISKPLKPIRKKPRTPSEDARIYGPQEFRDWLHLQCCAVCGWRGKPDEMRQAHAKTGGTARKDDWTRTLPMCGPHVELFGNDNWPFHQIARGCHFESGRGIKTFEKRHGVTLLELAAETQRKWWAHVAREGP